VNSAVVQDLLERLRDPHLLVEADGLIRCANRAARRLLRLSDDPAALPAFDALVEDPAERVHSYLRSCASTGSSLPGGFRLRAEHGGVRVRCHGAALPAGDDVDSNRSGTVILLHLQEHGAANEQFLLLNQKIEELTREARARREIEGALRSSERRLAFLSEASRLLGSSLDLETTLANIARSAVPEFADWSAVDLADEGGSVRRVAVEHSDPEKVSLVRRINDRYPPDPDASTGVPNVLRTGRTEVYADIDDAVLAAAAVDDEHLNMLRTLQLRSVVVAPLMAKSGALGAISFAFAESGRRHTDEDIAVIEDLSARAAVAIENAQLVRDMAEARDRIEAQAAELEHQTDELQNQAAVLEEQAVELEAQREMAEHAEQYMRSILDSIGDPLVVYDADWRFRYVNTAAAARMDLDGLGGPDQIIGRSVWDAYPDLVGSRYETEMRRARGDGVSVTFEEHNPHTGTWFEVRCDPLPDGGLAALWKDVTARKRAEFSERLLASAGEVLATSLEHRSTFANIARLLVPALGDWCAIDILTGDGRIERAITHHSDPKRAAWGAELQRRMSPTVEDSWGIGRVIRTCDPEFLPELNEELLAAVAPSQQHLEIWREIGLRSGMIVPLSARGRTIGALSLLYAESGRRFSADDLALATEIARRAALAVENARLFQEASEASRAKSQFLAIMSHELRTPLNAIIGYEDLLQAGIAGSINETQREQLARIRAGADQLLTLINQILSLSRIEAGREEVHAESLDLAELLGDSVQLLAPNAAKKGLQIAFQPPASAVTIRTDSGKLRQILLNLLSNAIKFTDHGRIDVRLRADHDFVYVDVEDTGVGIDTDDHDRIFEPFVQVDPSQTRRHGGTGLGLPVSRELARLLGGEIIVRSEPGSGSTFVLRLPR
jgi:PAS domain S-box-containing protein